MAKKAKPFRKRPRPPRTNGELLLEAYDLLARAAVIWYCAQRYSDANLWERADEDLKTAVILLMREKMMRSDLRPPWVLGFAHAFRSSESIQKRMLEVFGKYPWDGDFRPSDVRLPEFPSLWPSV